MMHTDDGALQAFLDDELPARDRADVAEHLLGCDPCHARYESLTQANALFAQSVSLLDVQAREPEQTFAFPLEASRRRRTRAGAGSFIKAAVLVLAVAAAASAAVPGSPIRAWVAKALEPAAAPAVDPIPSERDVAQEPPAPAPAGLSILPADGRLVVALNGLTGSSIRLAATTDRRASVAVVGADRDPEFRTGAGRLEVRDGAGGVVHVRLPLSVEGARLEVDGRLYAATRGGGLELDLPADTVGEEFVW